MISTTVSAARATLPALLARVAEGEEVTLTRHGLPVAVLVRPDALRARRAEPAFAAARELDDLLAAARHEPLSTGGWRRVAPRSWSAGSEPTGTSTEWTRTTPTC